MKNIFKFAAMAFAAVAMFAACEPEDKGGKDALTLDGKQWVYTSELDGIVSTSLIDFGATAKDTFYYGFVNDGAVMVMNPGTYTITPTDATSGTITIVYKGWSEEDQTIEFEYTDLTENSVKIDEGIGFNNLMINGTVVEFKLATEKIAVEDFSNMQ